MIGLSYYCIVNKEHRQAENHRTYFKIVTFSANIDKTLHSSNHKVTQKKTITQLLQKKKEAFVIKQKTSFYYNTLLLHSTQNIFI